MEEADYHRTEEDDYNRIVDLTRETDDLRRYVSVLRDDVSKAENALRAANNELRDSSDALKKEEDKAASLQAQIEKLLRNIEHERAATKDAEGRVEALYTDVDQLRFAHRSILADRDEALADKKEMELQPEDLREQWPESERRLARCCKRSWRTRKRWSTTLAKSKMTLPPCATISRSRSAPL